MNIELLNNMIAEGYIKVQKHPEQELYIYNYTAKAQYDRVWNDMTIMCRGIIMDADENIVARPFPKFFNLGEMEDQVIPQESFEVFEKMDGSLGILYWIGDTPYVASRGSFTSEQAVKANEMLNSTYKSTLDKLDKGITYLFEIVYPENRIVVDYGDREELVLLGMVDTKTGKELELKDIGFPVVKRYDGLNDIYELKAHELENKEGFVIKFKNDYRLKVKFEEYTRIHRIVTNVSSINIWEFLMSGQPMDEILERVPDEFYDWVKKTKLNLETQYQQIEAQAKEDFKVLDTRKESAFYYETCKYPSILFKMMDDKPYEEVIWRMLRPKHEKPFAFAEEAE